MPYADRETQLAAQREHYQRNKPAYAKRLRHWLKDRRKLIDEVKSVPCMDCGVAYPPFVMDLDHRDPKQKHANVSRLARSGTLKQLMAEIDKCDVVCSNCHRIRTHNQRKAA